MPTKKPRVTITMSEEQLKKIENYQISNNYKNQTQAILSLIDAGFSTLNDLNTSNIYNFSESEDLNKIIKKYLELDLHGKDIVETVLLKEYERVNSSNKKSRKTFLEPVAAHLDNNITAREKHLINEDIDEL